MEALLFSPDTRTVKTVLFERNSVEEIPEERVCVACMDGVFPGDYGAAARVLGVDNPLHVECWTARRGKKNTYKVWVANKHEYPPGGVRFFDMSVPFKGDCLVVRYKSIPKNTMDMQEIVKKVHEEGMFFECPEIKGCKVEAVRYEWIGEDKIGEKEHGYTIFDDNMRLRMVERMYTCACCGGPCPANRCGKCKKVHYCNEECQRRHWKQHKPECSNML